MTGAWYNIHDTILFEESHQKVTFRTCSLVMLPFKET
jgi:hypothetical protein